MQTHRVLLTAAFVRLAASATLILATYQGMSHHWGWAWALPATLVCLLVLPPLPVMLGAFIGVWHVWAWHPLGSAAFVLAVGLFWAGARATVALASQTFDGSPRWAYFVRLMAARQRRAARNAPRPPVTLVKSETDDVWTPKR